MNYTVEDKVKKIEAVKCETCGVLHDSSSDTFLSFHGNVCVGMGGGVIGNNFNDEGKLDRIMCFCRKSGCLDGVLLQFIRS